MNRARARLSFLCFPIALLIAFGMLSFPVFAGLPDLAVDSIWLEKTSAVGVPIAATDLSLNESFAIVASVKNLGQEPADGYYLDAYYDNDYGRGGPDSIGVGETQEWYIGPVTATAGSHVTQWAVDPDNQIAESNEGNNLKEYTFTVGSSGPEGTNGTTATVTTTVTESATSYVSETSTATITSYTATQAATSTIPTVTTVVAVPLTVTSIVQNTQLLTSTLTITVTSYATTETSASTIIVPATVTLGPLAVTSAGQTTQVLTSIGATTVSGYTTVTVTRYTRTETFKSTSVVYTTVTSSASHALSSPLTYLGAMSLLALTVGHRVTGSRSRHPRE